jgi:hypothetical protein
MALPHFAVSGSCRRLSQDAADSRRRQRATGSRRTENRACRQWVRGPSGRGTCREWLDALMVREAADQAVSVEQGLLDQPSDMRNASLSSFVVTTR